MFDIGFAEFLLLVVISLLVIGPERLPEVARTVGKVLFRLRRQFSELRDNFEAEGRKIEQSTLKQLDAPIFDDLTRTSDELKGEFERVGEQIDSKQ